jgi:protein-L-isoaspartate(D-aspartate) O-methyltransferase
MENLRTNTPSCKICLIAFDYETHSPRVLHCGHTVCTSCLNGITEGKIIKCPFCKNIDRDYVPVVNYEVVSMLHHKTTDNSCPKHSEEQLNFYCNQDKRLICQACLISGHLGHQLTTPKESEIGSTLLMMEDFEQFSKDIYQQKYDTSKALNNICTEVEEKFQNFSKYCENIKNVLKYDYVARYKKLTKYIQEFESLDKDLKGMYEAMKDGKVIEGNGIENKFKEFRNYYTETIKLYNSIEDNENYLLFIGIKDKMQEIYNNIIKNADITEISKPEYQDMENPVNYLIDEKNYIIRYKLRSSEQNQKLFRKLSERLGDNNEFATNILMSIDRKDFCHSDPYIDSPGIIGWNTTVSAPHMHFMTMTYLCKNSQNFKPGAKGIDIGTGTGFIALAFLKMLGPKSRVIALDHIEEIVNFAKSNIGKNHSAYLERIDFVTKNGINGYAEGGPYDVIHLGAAVEQITPELLAQLNPGGLLWAPVGPKGASKTIHLIIKDKDSSILTQKLMAVNYAEMTSVENQLHPRMRSLSSQDSDID